MIQDVWLTRHPYLQAVADFQKQAEASAAETPIPGACLPNWAAYGGDFDEGLPLLKSSAAAMDLKPAARALSSLAGKLASRPLPHPAAEDIRTLAAQLFEEQDAPNRAVAWLVNEDEFVPVHSGLLRYLGWTALARFLGPVVGAFANWRDEERWLRNYCPTCGSLPGMAQLVGKDPGRLRMLSCAQCRTRWRFQRTGCPFCTKEGEHVLRALVIEGEGELRIDYCESCGGYLKTYDGEGNERFLLADWSSLHLDIIARDRGLKRLGASLYEL